MNKKFTTIIKKGYRFERNKFVQGKLMGVMEGILYSMDEKKKIRFSFWQ